MENLVFCAVPPKKFCLNEDQRLTKKFPHQLFSKREILVLSSSKSLLISHLFHFSISEKAFKKKIEIIEKHSEVLKQIINSVKF